jgi:hypothetical protein
MEEKQCFDANKQIDFQDLFNSNVFLDDYLEMALHNGPSSLPSPLPSLKEKTTEKNISKEKTMKESPKQARVRFTAEEDEMIKNFVEKNGACHWEELAKIMPQRDRRSLRLRYVNTLSENDDSLFTGHDEEMLIESVKQYGRKWSKIRDCVFPDRADTSSKNRFNLIQRRSVQITTNRQIFHEEEFFDIGIDFDDLVF